MLSNARVGGSCACLLMFLAGCTCCNKSCQADAQSGADRSGNPSEVSRWAQPSDTGSYVGYAVGGGSARPAEGPTCHEGTWGWDYAGCWLPSRVILDWFHGKYQGGYGAYEIDGPRPLEEIERRREE